MTGTLCILNVGAGDTKLTFDKKNPAECIRAARIVEDMLRRGYALLVDVGGGKFQRATKFNSKTCEYIIADGPLYAGDHDEQSSAKEAGAGLAAINQAPPLVKRKQRRSRKSERAIPAAGTRAVAVARTAGG